MTRTRTRTLTAVAVSLGMVQAVQADITIGSWNLKHLGWNNDVLETWLLSPRGADLWALQK